MISANQTSNIKNVVKQVLDLDCIVTGQTKAGTSKSVKVNVKGSITNLQLRQLDQNLATQFKVRRSGDGMVITFNN